MTDQQNPLARVAADSELDYIGAGDAVVILSTGEHGVLTDVEGSEACVRYSDGSGALTFVPIDDVAHPDSPAVLAMHMTVVEIDGLHIGVSAERTQDGKPFVQLHGLDCNLGGEEPGTYYPTPIA